MTDWDLLTPGIGLTSIGIVGVGISLSGIAKTFIDGMHAVSLLTMFIGMIFLASGLFKDGFPSSGRAKSATMITLGFLVTFGVAAAVTVSVQVPSIFAYIGLMMVISIPAAVLAFASYKGVPYLKPLAVIFISGSIVAGVTFYAFGLVAPKPPAPVDEEEPAPIPPPAVIIPAKILAGATAEGNPDYGPDHLTVNRGEGVEWVNEDNAPHTVTSSDEGVFDSGLINVNATWLLNTASLELGDYEYFCTLHPYMSAMLTVTEGAPSTPSAGETPAAGQNQTSGNGTAATLTSVSIVSGAGVPTNALFYDPKVVTTSVGSMVTWTNDDTAMHTVTSGIVENNVPKPDAIFDSGIMGPGQTFSYLPDRTGEFDYYCLLHPFMTGRVVVN